jgi:predicted nucleic acid-binding protein
MPSVLFDTSLYISALRRGEEATLGLRNLGTNTRIWLSSVVLQELYAGADTGGMRAVERLERDFDRSRRILVPNLKDWIDAGKVLSRLAGKYHFEKIGQGRLTNDALIAMSAWRTGVIILTANRRDFARLAEFRSFQWQTIP